LLLPNGQLVYGASRADARFHQFIGAYFQPEFELRPGATVLDVGANIGMFSLEILRRCGGDAHILAFEPAPQTFAYLKQNVHDLFPNADVRLYQCALGDRKGETTLYYRPRAGSTASLYREPLSDPESLINGFLRTPPPEYRGSFSQPLRRLPRAALTKLLKLAGRWANAKVVQTQCPITTVSAVMHEHAIAEVDFLKIDVEGAELDVLRGVQWDDWPKIKRLAAEVHDRDNRVETIRELLVQSGFEHVEARQEWPFEGTGIYAVCAARHPARRRTRRRYGNLPSAKSR
jgi:FkbM family methyltransferase